MVTMATLENQWAALRAGSILPAHTRVSAGHPLELFAQIDAQRRPGLLALTDTPFDRPPVYSAVDLVVGRRDDGRWALSMSLTQELLAPHFSVMCEQIILQGQAQPKGPCAATFLLRLVARWHRLLALGPDGLLRPEDQQGLLGEVLVLTQASSRFGPEAAAASWVGPDDAPQDFTLPLVNIEVKTVQSGNACVTVSSLDQLETGAQPLLLAVVELVRCAPGSGGLSLFDAVSLARETLAAAPQSADRFEEQLGKAGYIDRDDYKLTEYRVLRTRWFSVGPGFPRLGRSGVPTAIRDARYQLLIDALANFETNAFAHDGRH